MFLVYTTFRSDSIIISRNEYLTYDEMMDNLFSTNTDSLQKNGEIYLDGTSFKFYITHNGLMRKVYAYSLGETNYPQLAAFIAQLWDCTAP